MLKNRFIKSKIHTITCFMCFALLSTSALAQNKKLNEKELSKLFKEAVSYLDYEEYYEAIPAFKKYLEYKPNDAMALFILGRTYTHHTHSKHEALAFVLKAYEINSKIDDAIEKELGEAYHHAGKYEEAIKHFKIYLDKHAKGFEKRYTERRLFECENALEFSKNPLDIKIENLGRNINSEYDDFSPVVSVDEKTLIFTSRRKGTTGNTKSFHGFYKDDIYISNYVDGQWTPARNLKEINTEFMDATVAITPDGKQLITWGEGGAGDLYYSKQALNGKWQKLQAFPRYISQKNTEEASAAISRDWLTLIFSSERKGGYGGMDLYMSIRDSKDGIWGKPVNLGPTINTPFDDDAPFIDIDNSLYFSSKGHKTMGGFDIFKAESIKGKMGDGEWKAPENLGVPINTPGDDIFYVVSGDAEHAYFNSVKDYGYGGEDIYRVKLESKKVLEIEEQEKVASRKKIIEEITGKKESLKKVKIVIRDMETNEIIEGAEVTISDNSNKLLGTSSEGDDGHNVATDVSDLKSIKISTETKGYLPATTKVELVENENGEHEYVVKVQKIEKEAKLNLSDIYFASNSFVVSPESFVEIDKLVKFMKNNPTVVARLEGHTDSVGSDVYNMNLSMNRCASVKKYMVDKGIPESALEVIGFGETKPIADNATAEGRDQNRRLEFVIDSH